MWNKEGGFCPIYDLRSRSCVMKDYANVEVLFDVTLEVEWVLVELGKPPFELSKEEQE
jgi:hypothetical protein